MQYMQKTKNKMTQQVMANLPMHRLGNSLKAFTKIGVDFGSPFLIKQGRGKASAKRYICLFTCLEINAVHSEIAL